MITDIERAGGVLRITDPSAAERLRVRRALHAARALQLVPEGHFLSYSGRDKGDLVIRMTVGEHPAHTAAHINPVPVIVDLTAEEIHPTVRDAQVSVCTECQDRTRLILHALATAAEQRGFTVGPARQESRASLAITAHGTAFPLFLAEGSIEVLDVDSVQYSWQRVTARTTQPSHQLELSIESTWAHRGRRYRWGDRQRWRLEDTLPQILREIEQRAQLDHERQLARERQKEQTRLDWQAAMDQARQKLLDANRRDVLRDQVETWHEAVRVRAYCDALEQHLVDAPAGEADTCAVREWITWARSYADRIDPLPTYPRIPPVPRASPEDLRPYLGGWSPHEPKRR
ncbi:hypothetical protein [Kitasatospora sp. NPDC001175]|uniref:hypothetical protein n=1 Tax=Kitasatospora sp. NPDC001175 TaxID=3157103 RepID=UPI003D0566E8